MEYARGLWLGGSGRLLLLLGSRRLEYVSVVVRWNNLAILELLADNRVGYPILVQDFIHLCTRPRIQVKHAMDNVTAFSRE